MPRLATWLHDFCWNRPRAVLALLALLSLLSAAAASRLTFSSDIANILPRKSPAVDAVAEVMEHFAFTGQMYLFFEKQDPAATDRAAMKLADGIARRLEGAPEVKSVDYRVTPESEKFLVNLVSDHGPLLIPEEQMPAFLERLTAPEIRRVVRRNRQRLESPGVGAADILAEKDPLDLTRDFFLKPLKAGRPQGTFDFESGYYFAEGRREMFMTLEGTGPPADVKFANQLVGRAEAAIAAARAETPEAAGWRVSLLGGYVVALANEGSIRSDMTITILSSIPPVLVMLLISLRRSLSLTIGFGALFFGILWTFGLAGAAFGHLTGVTVAFAGLLAGMGIDFTIHFVNRYRNERHAGAGIEEASRAAYRGSGPGIFIAMATSVASLLCLWVSAFEGLREFATLVGIGLFLVFAATAMVFPLLVRRLARRGRAESDIPGWAFAASWAVFLAYLGISIGMFPALGIATAASCILLMTRRGQLLTSALIVDRPRLAGLVALLVTGVAAAAMLRPPYGLPERETDVKNLRTEGETILEVQERMRRAYGSGIDPIFILVRAPDEDEALARADAVARSLLELPDATFQSIVQFVPPPARQKRNAQKLASVDPDRIVADLDAALDAEGFDPAAFDEARAWLRRMLAAREPIRPSSVSDPFFSSARGRFLAYDKSGGTVRSLTWVVPRNPLHIRQARENMVNRLREAAKAGSSDAVLSGFSVVVKEIDDRIGPDIFRASAAAGALTFLLAWILFGSFRWAALALLPGVVGTAWLIGSLRLMDVKMNYLNLIVFPLMMGMGTDNGLHLVARFRELKCRDAAGTISSLWRGLTLTSLTTVVGFGSLAFAANRAMKSLGIAISVGMLCYLFASLLVVPPILRWVERRAGGRENPPPSGGGNA
ncbi:MAG: MMPL family transporter [Planctomycetes bacterium]|nr:MMPL family transporter [Planctomycetota bacterium]